MWIFVVIYIVIIFLFYAFFRYKNIFEEDLSYDDFLDVFLSIVWPIIILSFVVYIPFALIDGLIDRIKKV